MGSSRLLRGMAWGLVISLVCYAVCYSVTTMVLEARH